MDAIVSFLSPARLNKYRCEGENLDAAFQRYQWNVQLAEAMLPALNYLEVGLRNALDKAVTSQFGKDWLLAPPRALNLSMGSLAKIDGNSGEFEEERDKPPTHDDLVAKLGFGFWAGLFHKRHAPSLWHRPHLIRAMFPHGGKEMHQWQAVAKKIFLIKRLRNRIAHHEPIWHLQPDAQVAHQTCLELIHAMSIAAAQNLAQIDRFPAVYAGGVHLVKPVRG